MLLSWIWKSLQFLIFKVYPHFRDSFPSSHGRGSCPSFMTNGSDNILKAGDMDQQVLVSPWRGGGKALSWVLQRKSVFFSWKRSHWQAYCLTQLRGSANEQILSINFDTQLVLGKNNLTYFNHNIPEMCNYKDRIYT